MKTVMKQLISHINIDASFGVVDEVTAKRIISYIETFFVDKEKEQIITAWNDHKYNKWGNENTIVDGNDYYNQTFTIII